MSAIARIGVIGGGQLAWMMALESSALGVEVVVQTPEAGDPAVGAAAAAIFAPLDDRAATAELGDRCDVVTFENEFIDLPALRTLEGITFRPSLHSLEPILDKYHQRCYFKKLGLPVPAFTVMENSLAAAAEVGFPCAIKARRHGYDGQGTAIVKDEAELTAVWERWGRPSVLLEAFVDFDRELAIVAARGVSGEIAFYPLVETQQEKQVCHRVLIPASVEPKVIEQSQAIARTLLEALDYVGVLGIELFLTPSGKVCVNEIAPRTHNSGHFSLDACATSQFAQHLRAVSGLPLGDTTLDCSAAVMVNLLGYERAERDYSLERDRLAEIPNATVRWYGKTQSRPGRKLGHVTVRLQGEGDLSQQQLQMTRRVESLWYGR